MISAGTMPYTSPYLRFSSLPVKFGKKAYHFAAIGDWGAGSIAQKAVAQQMEIRHQKRPFKAVLSLGDNIYKDGDINTHKNPYFLDMYPSLVHKWLGKTGIDVNKVVDWIVALGNHDCRVKQFTWDQIDFFRMPGQYYVRKGPGVDFFVLNTNTFDEDKVQQDWLRKALSESSARWKVVIGHHPIYTSYPKKPNKDPVLDHTLLPILKAGKVAFYLSGHQHCYERFKPLDDVYHVTSGGGGHALNRPSEARHEHSECLERKHHFLDFKLLKDKDMLKMKAYDSQGQVIDRVIAEKTSVLR